MRVESKYIAIDGKVFYDEQSCLLYENELAKAEAKNVDRSVIVTECQNNKIVSKSISKGNVVDFFGKMKCETCFFKKGCDELMNHQNRFLVTPSVSLCDAIRNPNYVAGLKWNE